MPTFHIRETRGSEVFDDRREFRTLFEALEAATVKSLRLVELGGPAALTIGRRAEPGERIQSLLTITLN